MNNNSKIFYDFLNWVGISLSDSSSPILILGYVFLVLSVICLSCAVNILIYLIVNKIIEHPKVLDKLSNWIILTKFINYYKKIRWGFIIFDVLFLILCLVRIIILCWKIISIN
jgi:hypothetical protein